eukprot:35069-Chlamydomonas_euryale.AAC.2
MSPRAAATTHAGNRARLQQVCAAIKRNVSFAHQAEGPKVSSRRRQTWPCAARHPCAPLRAACVAGLVHNGCHHLACLVHNGCHPIPVRAACVAGPHWLSTPTVATSPCCLHPGCAWG